MVDFSLKRGGGEKEVGDLKMPDYVSLPPGTWDQGPGGGRGVGFVQRAERYELDYIYT